MNLYKTLARRGTKLYVASPLPAVFFATLLLLIEYQVNITTVYPKSLVLPLLEAVLVGSIPFLLYSRILKSKLAIMVASLLAVPMLYDFEPRIAVFLPILKALLPISDDLLLDGIFILLVLLFCAVLGGLADKLAPILKLKPEKVSNALAAAIFASFSYTAVTTLIHTIRLYPQTIGEESTLIQTTVEPAKVKPDIYYIVLEDYASNKTLKSIYSYDNSPFLNELRTEGFTINEAAHSNYSRTRDSVPSTLSMDYLVSTQKRFRNAESSEFPMRAILDAPPAIQALQRQGYQYLHIGSWWTDTRKIPSATNNYADPFKIDALGLHKTMTEFEYNILSKSVFSRFLTHGLSIGSLKVYSMAILSQREVVNYQLDTLNALAESSIQGGRFIFAHFMSPHPPFLFDADGAIPTYGTESDDQGASAEKKYVNQLLYINNQVEKTIKNIQKNAKTPPIIILQSDEGPHPREMGTSEPEEFDVTKLPDNKLEQKYGTLAAYSLPGASPDVLARLDSPVNTFRVVLDNYFGYDLPNLPVCSFGIPNRKTPYDFVDVTARLDGSEDLRCKTIHQ
jgi:hypothetical protein